MPEQRLEKTRRAYLPLTTCSLKVLTITEHMADYYRWRRPESAAYRITQAQLEADKCNDERV